MRMRGLHWLMVLMLLHAGMSQADCYRAAPPDSQIQFDFAIERSQFSGHFSEFELMYCWQNTPEDGDITVSINMASVRTGNSDLDIGMQEKEGLDTDRFPTASWQTDTITKQDGQYHASGELSIHGISHNESGLFRLEPNGDNWRLTGSSELMRLDYQVGTGEFADTRFIPDGVTVHFDFVLKPAEQTLERE